VLGKTNNSDWPRARGPRRSPLSADALLPPAIKARLLSAQRRGASPEQAIAWAQELGDGLGRGLDPEMIAPLAACHLIGVPTTACCQGHDRRQRPNAHSFPWIDFAAPIENGQFLLAALPDWTIVQRGQGAGRSYRLNPQEITAIDDQRYDQHPYSFWQPARQQLQELANNILQR